MAALTNGQAQVGGVTVGSQIANPLDTATAGITTGADWAMRNYQVQGQMAMMQQQAQQMQLENMKTRYSIGQTLYDRMQRIARLPMGNAKNSEIDLLGQDMGHLGMELHPSAVALMKDKELSKGLGTVLNSLNIPPGTINPQTGQPYTPQEAALARVQATSQLPNFLSSDKILDMYTEQLKNAQAVNLKQAEMQHGTNLEQMRQTGDDTRQQKKLDQERQIFGVKTTGEIRGEATKNAKDYQDISQAYQRLYRATLTKTGANDDTIINQFNQLQGNATLRSYEAQMYGQGASLIEQIRAKVGSLSKGTHLSPLQRQQIGSAAKDLQAVADRAARNVLMPSYAQIQNLGTDPKLVFAPNVLKLLNTPEEQMLPLPPVAYTPQGQKPQRQAPVAPQGPLSSARQAVNPKTPVMLSPGQVAAGRALVQQLGPDQASKAIAQRMGLQALSPAMQRQLGIPVAGGQ